MRECSEQGFTGVCRSTTTCFLLKIFLEIFYLEDEPLYVLLFRPNTGKTVLKDGVFMSSTNLTY